MKKYILLSLLAAFIALGLNAQILAATTIRVQKTLITPGDGNAQLGDLVNFQVTIANLGRLSVISLSMTDLYNPAYLELVSVSIEPDAKNTDIGELMWNDLTETLGDLGPGDVFTLSMTFEAVGISAVAPAMNTVNVNGIDERQDRVVHDPVTAYVNIMQTCADDPWEPNGPDKLASIPTGQAIRAYICPAGDEDYYGVKLTENGTWFFRLYQLPRDYNLYLYDGLRLLASSENKGTMPESIAITTQSPRELIVVVRGGQYFSYNESYQLKVMMGGATTGDTNEIPPDENAPIVFQNLPPGPPDNPTQGFLYLDSISAGNLLSKAPVLPDGRLVGSFKLPLGTSGDHRILAELKSGSQTLGISEAKIAAKLVKVKLHLWIDDAWMISPSYHFPAVNKVTSPDIGSFGKTIVDVCCAVEPKFFKEDTASVQVMVQGDKLDSPEHVYVRDGFGGNLNEISYTDNGGGIYSATLTGVQKGMDRQLVFRFRIPSSLADKDLVGVTGKAFATGGEELYWFKFPRLIRILKGCNTVIFANRRTLFRDHDDTQVAELLGNLYLHSDEWWKTAPKDRPAMIYYIDQYRTESVVRNWDNSSISYASEFIANEGARLNHQFMINRFIFYNPKPYYILIVGNDEQFPFYRIKDPVSDEKKWIDDGKGNPAMTTCLNDYYFTDNFYADWFMGSVSGLWQEGKVDLKLGRIIGDSAADMLQLYLAGLNVNGGTGRSVMASVAGWELGFEPDDGRPGEIGDFLNVPLSLSLRGLQVLNDYESPRTIDVMTPYPSNWATGFQAAANGGMDIFFIGGHNSYSGASLPYDGFGPSDIPSKYHRFDDDHPICMIVGCHGGLPVPHGGYYGGVNHSMVYNVIHHGARAYYGASGYSYGSPGCLHWCTWAERLLQYNFYYFLCAGSQSRTLGYALQQARINFPFGLGSNTGLDRKTVTEFNLFGVPWQNLDYPGGIGGADQYETARLLEKSMPAPLKRERKLMLAPRRVVKLSSNIYQQSFTVETSSWKAEDFEGFKIIDIPDGGQQLIPDAPVLPAVTRHSIALPGDGKILDLTVTGITTDTLGQFNIPTVKVGAWTESGISYTTDTAIDYFYPPEIAYSHEGEHNHHLFSVFPVRHNPTTDETVLHPDFEVTITYEAPVPFGILDFTADDAVVAAGQSPSFSARIFNMGDAELPLSGTLAVTDVSSGDGISTATLNVPLSPGVIYDFQTSMAGVPDIGQYSAVLTLKDAMDRSVTAETNFSVVAAQMTNLVAVWNPIEEKSLLSVDIENLSDKGKTLTLAFSVMNSEGIWQDTVYSSPVSMGAGEKKNIQESWIPSQIATEAMKIQAVGALDGMPLNPLDATLFIFSPDDLFNQLINHILGRKTLQPVIRNMVDLNSDERVDAADIIIYMEKLK